jgi:urease accessory protein
VNRSSLSLLPALAGGLLFLAPTALHAHTGAGASHGLMHGFAHPLGGVDHLLAMIAVGIWAAQRQGERLWLLPVAFVGAMLLGFVLGAGKLGLPGVELAVVASVITLGVLVALASRAPTLVAVLLVGGFALFHGHAHGTEMGAGLSGLAYGAGFAVATALLHATGIALVVAVRRLELRPRRLAERTAGATIALAGVAIWML